MVAFKKEFFEEEERNEFVIEPMMKNAWAAQIELLSKVDALCQKYDISYCVDWGTLLGAVRHQGYIPWDDDMDICMRREDLYKFFTVIAECQDELKCLSVYSEPEWGAHAIKIVNGTSTIANRKKIREYHGFSLVTGIDVFPLDYVPRSKELEKEQVGVTRLITEVCHLKREIQEYAPTSREYIIGISMIHDKLEQIKQICQIEFSQENPTLQELYILLDEVYALYEEKDADYLTEMPCLGSGRNYYVPKEMYDHIIRVPFENIMVPIPEDYDYILRLKYGDGYMEPRNVKAGHDYPFYNTLIQAVADIEYNGDAELARKNICSVSTDYYHKFLNRESEPTLAYKPGSFLPGERNEGKEQNFAAQMEVLAEVDRICKKYNLAIYAVGQTLLDIVNQRITQGKYLEFAMKRQDYISFVNCLPKELGVWFDFRSIYRYDEVESLRLEIVTDGLQEDLEKYRKRFHGCTEEVGIRIQVLDAVCDDRQKEDARRAILEGLLKTADNVGTKPPYSETEQMIVRDWEKVTGIEIDMERNLHIAFYKVADSVAGNYCDRSESLYCLAELQDGMDIMYEAEWFDETVRLPLGQIEIPVPRRYRDVMELYNTVGK